MIKKNTENVQNKIYAYKNKKFIGDLNEFIVDNPGVTTYKEIAQGMTAKGYSYGTRQSIQRRVDNCGYFLRKNITLSLDPKFVMPEESKKLVAKNITEE